MCNSTSFSEALRSIDVFFKDLQPYIIELRAPFSPARPNDEGIFLPTENADDLRKIEYNEVEAVADTEQEGESEEKVIANMPPARPLSEVIEVLKTQTFIRTIIE